MTVSKIIYTKTDEAPALATYSLLPIIKAFAKPAEIDFETRDISLAGRVIASFPDKLTDDQKIGDALTELGELAKLPTANIIKLPNISASVSQLKTAIQELQDHEYDIPDYPEVAENDEEAAIRARYVKILGSAVNPVLREGNSDRRVAAPVKAYAQTHPHWMGEWNQESKSHVSSMKEGDFHGSEQSVVMSSSDDVKIQHTDTDGNITVLKESTPLEKDEVIDASLMSVKKLRAFYEEQMQAAKEEDILLSLHLKATMMKVSDPIMFGHAVSVYFKDVFKKHAETFAELGINPKYGLGDLYEKITELDDDKKTEIETDIDATYANRPALAMVDSDNGITNLHVSSKVIIDASMPAAIRNSGKMWNSKGESQDTKSLIPDRNYSGIYQATIDFCMEHGAFDVATMGDVSNVGLMAKKAEEYGSHDKTFEIAADGKVEVINQAGDTLMAHDVEKGDIWRMCQTKDIAIKDWVKLAVKRARATGYPAIFWLDDKRPHDMNLMRKVETYLPEHNTEGLDIQIMNPLAATHYTLSLVREGKNAISVTGNVLRDYLTDLFPILELGTSAKMLSIVPLLAGGGLFETGAGGSAPKHVQQFMEENHLRWDSLGEYLALAESLEEIAEKTGNPKAHILAEALNEANGHYLENNNSPSRESGELDNRGSSFYLAKYWAQALASQDNDEDLKIHFTPIAKALTENEDTILKELESAQGQAMDIGGYYHPDVEKVSAAMRPSATFNAALEG